jgi:hypothetical protein
MNAGKPRNVPASTRTARRRWMNKLNAERAKRALSVAITLFFALNCYALDFERLADAIGKAENSKSHPYGILAHYAHTTPRRVLEHHPSSTHHLAIKTPHKRFWRVFSLSGTLLRAYARGKQRSDRPKRELAQERPLLLRTFPLTLHAGFEKVALPIGNRLKIKCSMPSKFNIAVSCNAFSGATSSRPAFRVSTRGGDFYFWRQR